MRPIDVVNNLSNHDFDIGSYHLVEAECKVCIEALNKYIVEQKEKSMLLELYSKNVKFKSYVDAYCVKHDVNFEEALNHLIVKEYGNKLHEELIEQEKAYADNNREN